jgi:hypothetical protein
MKPRIRNVQLFTPTIRPEPDNEKNFPESMCDTGGYVDQTKRVNEFLAAGLKLKAYRVDMSKMVDWEEEDVTRQPDFDIIDASRMAKETTKKLRKQRDELDNKKATPAGDSDGNKPEPEGTEKSSGKKESDDE